jgi:hypothetical protein
VPFFVPLDRVPRSRPAEEMEKFSGPRADLERQTWYGRPGTADLVRQTWDGGPGTAGLDAARSDTFLEYVLRTESAECRSSLGRFHAAAAAARGTKGIR